MRTLKKLLKKLYYIGTVYADEVPSKNAKQKVGGGVHFLIHRGHISGFYKEYQCKKK